MDEEPVAHRFIKPGTHRGKGLAVFTSGGDSQGMYFYQLNDWIYFLNLNFQNMNIVFQIIKKLLKVNTN